MSPSRRLPASFYKEIQQLLKRSHVPRVKVAPSSVLLAGGDGVFAQDNVDESLPLCLYPGVYTPGMPLHAGAVADDANSIYLANELLPPSGVANEDNAYIFNLSSLGGYLDGMALKDEASSGRLLDENPSACAHKINHSSSRVNARLVPFYWKDLPQMSTATTCELFDLPNSLRNDNSPWYFDDKTDKLYRFTRRDTAQQPLCGAAVLVTRPLLKESELFLDYSLKKPLPLWARDWYDE